MMIIRAFNSLVVSCVRISFKAFYRLIHSCKFVFSQANAQEKFMRIKHAYNTLLNSETRRKYDSGSRGSDFSYSAAQRSRVSQEEEEYYGLGTSSYCHFCFL